jgi:thiol-disulfide isomerase/thioredoxin
MALALALALAPVGSAAAAEPTARPPAPAPSLLELTNGGFVPGAILDSDWSDVLRWLCPYFDAPFEFDLNRIEGVQLVSRAEPPRPTGDARFDLVGGDVLFGTLVELDEREVVIDASRLGRLHVERSRVRRIERFRDRAEPVYLGPNGLAEWPASAPKGAWRSGAGRLATTTPKAALRGDVGLPARAVVEFEIGWLKKPDFGLALGVDPAEDETAKSPGFRFEVWGEDLTALRESNDNLALASVAKVAAGPGRVHLRAYLDQEQGRLLVTSPEGKVLANLGVHDPTLRPQGGIALINARGDVRLERLEVRHWDGQAPPVTPLDRPYIERRDGSLRFEPLIRFDPAVREFVVGDAQRETRVAEDQVVSISLAAGGRDLVPRLCAVTQDGQRLGGELLRVEKGELFLSVPGIREELRLALAGVRSLLRNAQIPAVPTGGEKDAILELEGVRLPGRLIDGRAEAGASCLVWLPRDSDTAAHLRPDVSGKITLREPPPRPPAPAIRTGPMTVEQLRAQRQAVRVIVQQPNGALMVQVRDSIPTVPAAPPAKPGLHLRTGDVIPAEVTRIDGDGVWFQSPLARTTFVAHDKVKAIELAPESPDAIRVGKSKRERLLTLPRMQKEAPPTHLIRSRDGDYLRGRVVALDDAILQVEVHVETRNVPRDRIARIIWLHADELDASTKKGAPGPAEDERAPALRVQALRSNGDRLTFAAEQVANGTVMGPSEVLGACHVALAETDQLLLGGAIEQAAAQLAYQQWKLQNAPEPRAFQDDGSAGAAGRAPGTEALLVGKPAPDFQLDLLGGGRFHLADAKARGQVVLLDFWATWCGPCVQAMPQVERVAQEFRDRGVQLVAVNLQESPDRISAMLDRLQLHPAVALDRDGKVAESYAAHAIPQTVIIDRNGTVARLFVGGGPRLGDQLRDALNAVLSDKDSEPGGR